MPLPQLPSVLTPSVPCGGAGAVVLVSGLSGIPGPVGVAVAAGAGIRVAVLGVAAATSRRAGMVLSLT
jgi:hypothetical protein